MSKASEGSKTIEGGKVSPIRKFTKVDMVHIEERVLDVYETRKKERATMEQEWREIDRQLAMQPDCSHKKNSRTGMKDPKLSWMPEIELPLQSQTLEVLTADTRRLMFPSSGSWFSAHAAMTDEYLRNVDLEGIITGDENDVPSIMNQDNINKIAEGVISHWHDQYDFVSHVDMINAEAFKYGVGIGRGRMVKKSVLSKTAKGVMKETSIVPILIPRSIKDVYLDSSKPNLMNEGYELGSSIISTKTMDYNDFMVAATRGSADPNDEMGGWIKAQLKGIEPNDKNCVEVVEMEGDFSIPRKTTRGFFLPGIIVTVIIAGKTKSPIHKLVRLRFRKHDQNSYIEFPYHVEDLNNAYPTSPLRKGYPIQKAACEALMQVIISAWLNNLPPVGYDRNDTTFAAKGGPQWFPGAQWGTMGDVKVHGGLGDPSALFSIYSGFLQQYADVTGVNAPRLGAATVSHTTAFAKEAELNRGASRTVDYSRSMLDGPLSKWLDMEYKMGRPHFKKSTIYLPASGYEGYVDLERKHLPELVHFEAIGAGAPSEEQQKQSQRLNSAQLAMSIDQMNIQMGGNPELDLPQLIRQTLREGGWTDVDAITGGSSSNGGPQQQPNVQVGAPSDQTEAGIAAIQGLT
jgi:hypothetical protein